MPALTLEQIHELISHGESIRCEFKSDLSSKDNKEKICRTICAFANDVSLHGQAGIIVMGLDSNGAPTQLTIDDELELSLLNIRGDGNIVPLPSFVTRAITYRDTKLLVIEVSPAISPPVKYKGAIWVRPGNATRVASNEDEGKLNAKRRHLEQQPDDVQPLYRFAIDDLNLNLFRYSYLPQAFSREVLDANGRTLEEQLSSCKMVAPVESFAANQTQHPTVLGMLCLGISPTDAIPGAYVQFLRIDGLYITDPIIDEAQIQGVVSEVISRTEQKFDAHVRVKIDITSQTLESRQADYPKAAFEQIFRNAILHRSYFGTNAPIRVYWYNDRIEISSPGGPYGLVTIENFGKQNIQDYRNPNLGEALRNMGYVQRFGAGIGIANRVLEENRNPLLEWDISENFVIATLRKAP